MKAAIEAIHASPRHAVLHLAGGASQALGWLLSVPRASQTLLEATVPYTRASMIQLLGRAPQQYASREVADEMATAAYNRALTLSLPGTLVAGFGVTGALTTGSPKRGDHRCHISARTHSSLWRYDLTLYKGYRDRFGEDCLSSQLLIKVMIFMTRLFSSPRLLIYVQAMADVCEIGNTVPVELKTPEEEIRESRLNYTEDEELEQLIHGNVCMVRYPGEDSKDRRTGRRVVLSGAFNPLHEGHLTLMSTACTLVQGGSPCFELSAINADKPALPVHEIRQRVKQFVERGKTMIVTNQPFFYKKAEILPDSTFLVGVDTAMRLVNEKYYGGSRERMMEVLLNVQRLGCDFMVAGRIVDGVFKTMLDVNVPEEVKEMFSSLPENVFRVDLSSTEIRQKASM
ncbi:uncharacterized protein LOC9658328 isoform X1 [Selaginella moellendorffii]|nr:uncharacterized protein LOC9658328 isoform X1 [Selaginella moellendorffii]|eukprot:XP_002981133.2 uncharacterized protein LOC9658328 isoform X1 [Selaginella moellendorffii]